MTIVSACPDCGEPIDPAIDPDHICGPGLLRRLEELRAASVQAVNNLSERVGRLEHKVCGDRR